jgi:hypothetical protein
VKKAIVLLLVICGCFELQAQSNTIYVKAGANGNGTSWVNAIGDLHHALKVARPGTQVWVAGGTYFTSSTNDRNASFVIPDGINLIGSFAGSETSISQRINSQNPTILSGEIGQPLNNADNALTVVYTRNVTNLLVDGFIIADGNANLQQMKSPASCGGGWYNDGSNQGTSSPRISNCIFVNNAANYGAGLYNAGTNGSCDNTLIENCTFESNIAQLDGGGIYNEGSKGSCNIKIINTDFNKNQATYGGGVFNTAEEGQTISTIDNSSFVNNTSVDGSCIYNARGTSSLCKAYTTNCRFESQALLDNVTSSNKMEEGMIKITTATPRTKSNLRASTF